jgi:hypothetical protein
MRTFYNKIPTFLFNYLGLFFSNTKNNSLNSKKFSGPIHFALRSLYFNLIKYHPYIFFKM